MLAASDPQGQRVYAWDVTKSDGPFHCPGCRSPVIAKQGYIKAAHFAHEAGAACPYAEYHRGESDVHLGAKKDLLQALSTCQGVTDLKLERYLGPVRPDVSFRLHDLPVAIEMQVSRINPKMIERRTKEYTRRGIFLLWLCPWREVAETLQQNRFYDPPAWVRYIHTILYQGWFYYWLENTTIRPVHFDEAQAGPEGDALFRIKEAMMIASIAEDQSLLDLQPLALSARFSAEDPLWREAKLFGVPSVWPAQEELPLSLANARARYPARFLDPAQFGLPADVTPFSGDPFDEDAPVDPEEFLDRPPGPPRKCPVHGQRCRYIDRFGMLYCDHPVCWSRYRFLLLGAQLDYPEVVAVTDARDYLPDLAQAPLAYQPSPIPSAPPLPIYPARPPLTRRVVAAGEEAWQACAAEQDYGEVALALKTLDEQARRLRGAQPTTKSPGLVEARQQELAGHT